MEAAFQVRRDVMAVHHGNLSGDVQLTLLCVYVQ